MSSLNTHTHTHTHTSCIMSGLKIAAVSAYTFLTATELKICTKKRKRMGERGERREVIEIETFGSYIRSLRGNLCLTLVGNVDGMRGGDRKSAEEVC